MEMTFGEKIKECRKAQNLTQNNLLMQSVRNIILLVIGKTIRTNPIQTQSNCFVMH